jgi:nucleoside triphosphate diphosphatase
MLYLMQCLRDPNNGCPWDQQQVFSSIVPHTIEETYEVADAIARDDMKNLKEELGDLLFQIIFYCQMANEKRLFDFNDVIKGLQNKMLRRHPHVFPDGSLQSFGKASSLTEEELKGQWDAIKAQEKALSSDAQSQGVLDSVSRGLPPIIQSTKIQKKAAKLGFDWNHTAPVFSKIREELDELEEAINTLDQDQMSSEFGDVLFAMINLGRHLNLDPEKSLSKTNEKFRRRFSYIEKSVSRQRLDMSSCSLETLDEFWNEAKRKGL